VAIGNQALRFVISVKEPGCRELPLVVDASNAVGVRFGARQGGQEQRGEDGEDGDDDEQLDQCESHGQWATPSHGTLLERRPLRVKTKVEMGGAASVKTCRCQ
jgi:hypothetical protein